MIINIKFPEIKKDGLYFLDFVDEIASTLQIALEDLNAGDTIMSYEIMGMSKDGITLDVNVAEFSN
jgi:hypothetical protein